MADAAPIQWNAPEFELVRQSIMDRFACSEEDAIARLQAVWDPVDIKRRPSPPIPPMPPSPPPPEQAPLEDEDPVLPTRRKNTIADFDTNTQIPDGLPFFPAQFAMDKLKAYDYV